MVLGYGKYTKQTDKRAKDKRATRFPGDLLWFLYSVGSCILKNIFYSQIIFPCCIKDVSLLYQKGIVSCYTGKICLKLMLHFPPHIAGNLFLALHRIFGCIYIPFPRGEFKCRH